MGVRNMAASNPARDADAMQYRAQGWTFAKIANALGMQTAGAAHRAVERAMARSWREPTDAAKTLIIADLNRLKARAWEVLEAEHIVISQGRVVRRENGTDDNGDPVYTEIPDDGPVLEALDRILKVDQELAKLYGLYAPTRSEVTHITLDAIDTEIAALEAALESHDA